MEDIKKGLVFTVSLTGVSYGERQATIDKISTKKAKDEDADIDLTLKVVPWSDDKTGASGKSITIFYDNAEVGSLPRGLVEANKGVLANFLEDQNPEAMEIEVFFNRLRVGNTDDANSKMGLTVDLMFVGQEALIKSVSNMIKALGELKYPSGPAVPVQFINQELSDSFVDDEVETKGGEVYEIEHVAHIKLKIVGSARKLKQAIKNHVRQTFGVNDRNIEFYEYGETKHKDITIQPEKSEYLLIGETPHSGKNMEDATSWADKKATEYGEKYVKLLWKNNHVLGLTKNNVFAALDEIRMQVG
jgi:hypothetical protein